MRLVGYSDSEGSENEQVKPQSARPSAPAQDASHKSSFEKVARGNKIRVNLPDTPAASALTSAEGDDLHSGRPTKRAKPNSAFSGINSFLPPPKNPGAKSSGVGGAGNGRSISLKTGATPAFSRELPEMNSNAYAQEADNGDYDEFGYRKDYATGIPAFSEQEKTQEESSNKPAGKPMMFKPLSVGRKPTKKKIPTQSTATSSSVASPTGPEKATSMHTVTAIPTSTGESARRPVQSLFSTYQDELPVSESRNDLDYQPEFVDTKDIEESLQPQDDAIPAFTAAPPVNTHSTPASDLQSLASTLNLTPAQRRQLFGRGDTSSAKLTNFNLAQEYSANNQLMQDEANTPIHNPVRSIAPGKHSLQQLVNQAANQRDALEESFASSKRNKAAAGSKYGW